MTLRDDIRHHISSAVKCGEEIEGQYEITVVFREFLEDSKTYFVAECLEIPGCVSQGDTQEEAAESIEEAIQLCLGVMFRDALTRFTECRNTHTDLRGISAQRRLTINQPQPKLAYA